ncbi:MAG: hypothetical protein SGI83_17630 [Bacteroidota bacterium]|nr:hypothetical protein [Bacteroidota bacterium]
MNLLTTISIIVLVSVNAEAQTSDHNISVSKALFIPTEKTILYKIGDRSIPVKILQYGSVNNNIICLNLHDNETTSVKAARSVLEETGGTLIKLENNNQRVIRFRLKGISYGFDPNRMFSRVGIEQTLRDNRKISRDAMDEVEKFAIRVLQLIPDSISCVIALHNNTEEAYSVRSYLPGGNRDDDAKAVYADSLQDVDDIVFTTDSLLYQRMADSGYNSIWQNNEKAKKDGSLSIYFGERNRPYVNIETQHGRVTQYIEMLQKLLMILAEQSKEMPQTADNLQ